MTRRQLWRACLTVIGCVLAGILFGSVCAGTLLIPIH